MLVFGLLLCAITGVALGATSVGAAHLTDDSGSGVAYFVIGLNVAPWAAAAGFALLGAANARAIGRSRRSEPPLPELRPVLARIETSRAVGDGPDLPLRLGLTVAPEDRPGYRVEIGATVNLMDMDDYRVDRIVVAGYDPERPWRVEITRAPTAAWSGRAALAKIDSAPIDTLVSSPPPVPPTGRGVRSHPYRPGLYALLVGLAVSFPYFWGW